MKYFTTLFWGKFIHLKLKIHVKQAIDIFFFAWQWKGGVNYLFWFSSCYQAESSGSLQDFNEQKRKEQQKLEEIKVHVQQNLFLHMNVRPIHVSLTPLNITRHLSYGNRFWSWNLTVSDTLLENYTVGCFRASGLRVQIPSGTQIFFLSLYYSPWRVVGCIFDTCVPQCDSTMQLTSPYVPSHYLAVWPCEVVPVKDPHFTLMLTIESPVAQCFKSTGLDHRGSWIEIASGTNRLFSELMLAYFYS